MTKRLFPLIAMVAVLTVGFSVPGEAQGRFFVGARVRPAVVFGGGFYYPGAFWYGYPFGYPWYAYQYPVGPYPPYPGYYPRFTLGAAARLEVTPREAEVFVDGFYAGIVDDFDGVFQRLPLAPGTHEITIYREGLRTVHQTVNAQPGVTLKIKYKMQPLAAGDVAEPRPTPPAPPAGYQGGPNPAGPPPSPAPGRGQFGVRLPPPPPPNQPGPRPVDTSSFGQLSIRVQPDGASVVIDGQRWEGPQGQNRLIIDVSEGPHRVEIQRDGFEPYSSTVTVRRGETTPLNVSLRTR